MLTRCACPVSTLRSGCPSPPRPRRVGIEILNNLATIILGITLHLEVFITTFPLSSTPAPLSLFPDVLSLPDAFLLFLSLLVLVLVPRPGPGGLG